MNNKVRPNKTEGGITLISLIVMIILLVILAAVTIRGVTGQNGILGSTTSAVQRYSIEEYREKIAETAQKTILASAILGEEASIDNLKNNLNSAVNGFQTITMNDNISDVIVKTNEGYLFDVYFDEVFSEYFVEYMGQIDSSYIPEVNITYTEASGKIDVTASGNINRITITNKGKEVAGGSDTTLSYTAINSGIYKIAVETKEGITRYGYVNVGLKKEKLKAPEIKVAAGNEGNNGWYKTDVNVEIDPKSTNGQTMKYRLTGAMKQDETPITNMADTTTISVTGAGLTKVIAWVELEEDGKTYRSDYAYYNVKIDNVDPDAPIAKVTATEGNELESQDSKWYKTNIELEITANDDNSGVYGYTYSITGTKSVSETALIGKTQKIAFETDGTYTLIIKAIDKAGNISTPYTITVYKDSTPPNQFTPNISNITNTGFTISAYTIDEASGIAKYEYYVNNEKKYEGIENTYTVSGLSKDTTYGVYVNAYDKAGNIQASSAISAYTAGSTSGETTGGNVGGDGSTIGFGTYTITYDANLPEGVEAIDLPPSRTFAHGETVTLPNYEPVEGTEKYNFLAWSTDKAAQETLYYPRSKITGYGNITLYAIWTRNLKLGDYVAYSPDGGSNTYSTTQDGEERSGYKNQDISRDTSLTWRVMNISENTLTLIATKPSSYILWLQNENGYNNGVKLLNDACRTLYSNSTLEATARSVKVEDINSLMGYSPTVMYSTKPTNYFQYPVIFQYEKYGSIDGSYTGDLGQSEQSAWYIGKGTNPNLEGKYTGYNYEKADYKAKSTVEYALAAGVPQVEDGEYESSFWIATRCITSSNSETYTRLEFSIFIHTPFGNVDSGKIASSASLENAFNSRNIRPVVEIPLESVKIGETGNGGSAEADRYSIRKR